MESQWKAERALLGRILYKSKNQFSHRFRVYDRLRAVFDSSADLQNAEDILSDIDKARDEILRLLPLGHNLPFLLPALAAIARIHCLVRSQSKPASPDEDWGELVAS
jgi:hypothetical protein